MSGHADHLADRIERCLNGEPEDQLRAVLESEGGFADAEELRLRFSTWTRDELTAAKEAIRAKSQQDRSTGRWFVVLPDSR